MLSLLKEYLARKEILELERIKSILQEYRRWLSEFPMIRMTLENMLIEIEGKQSLDACHPPFKTGPWTVENLRYKLRELVKAEKPAETAMDADWRREFDKKHEAMIAAQTQAKELQAKLDEAAALTVQQNRTINNMRILCGEAYQQSRTQSFLDEKTAQKLFEASMNVSVTTDKDAS